MLRIFLVGALFLGALQPAFCAAVLEKQTSTPGTVGVPYTFSVEFQNTDYTNTCLNLTWTKVPPGVQLNTGLTLSCDVGYFYQPGQPPPVYPQTASTELDWTPTSAGVFPAQIQVTNNTNTYSAVFNFTIPVQAAPAPPSPLAITNSSPLPSATVGKPYSVTFTASGGTPGYFWSLSGDYPASFVGIGITGEPTYTLSGTPTEVPTGPYLITATVKDSTGTVVNKQFQLTVASDALTITTTALPDAPLNQTYGPFSFPATGGSPGYSWQLAAGSGPLPPGMTLNTNGSLTGIPSGISASTVFQFTVQVTDSNGQTAVKNFQLTIAPAIPRSVTLLDPVPLITPPSLSASANLLQGSHVSTDPNVLASSYARVVQGIAADGFSQIVIKVPTGQPGQTVTINLIGDPSCSAGTGWTGGVALPTDITGLNPLAAAQTSVQAVSAAVGNQALAFAIYVSPADFDCAAPASNATTSPIKERSVTLHITSDSNSYTDQQIQIVRPPVLLVHGLNDDATAWSQVKPMLDNTAAFQVDRADYSDPITVTSMNPPAPFNWVKSSALGSAVADGERGRR